MYFFGFSFANLSTAILPFLDTNVTGRLNFSGDFSRNWYV